MERAWSRLRIGGPISKGQWESVLDALVREWGGLYHYDDDNVTGRPRYLDLRDLEQLGGLVLEQESEDTGGGSLFNVCEALRAAGICYEEVNDVCKGAFCAQRRTWRSDDPHRGEGRWSPLYNDYGERVVELSEDEAVIHPEILRRAWDIALHELAIGTAYAADLVRLREHVIYICTNPWEVPPISIAEN